MNEDTCKLCLAEGPDMRTLKMRYFYSLEEMVPEFNKDDEFYSLRTCKTCRGELLGLLRQWRDGCVSRRSLPKDSDGGIELDDPERNIPMRVNGATVMMTRKEYDAYQP